MFSASSGHKLRSFFFSCKSLITSWEPSSHSYYNPHLFSCSFSVLNSVSIPSSPYEASNSEAKHWTSDLNHFFERLYTVRNVHSLLKDMPWSLHSQEKLKALNVTFNVEIVSQVLRCGHLPPATCLNFFFWLRDERIFVHTFHTYDALIGMLRVHGLVQDMSRVIDDYRDNTCQQDQIYFYNLIRWYAKSNNVDDARVMWDNMIDRKIRPGIGLCNIMIDLLGSYKRYHELLLVYHRTVYTGSALSVCTYAILIKHLASDGKLDVALELFDRLPLLKLRQTALMFAILIANSVSVSNQELVRRLRMQIIEDCVKPTRQVVAFMQAMLKVGKLIETDVIGQSFWPELTIEERTRMCASAVSHQDDDENDIETCNAEHEHNEFMYYVNDRWSDQGGDACLNVPGLAHALRRWTNGTDTCLAAAQVKWTSHLVYKVLCRIRKADIAWNFFNWVQVQPGFIPEAPIISRLIVLLAVNRDMLHLEQTLSNAKGKCIPLSVHVISIVIKAFGMMKDSDRAVEVFHSMKDFGSEPNVEVYANVIHALVKQGHCLKAKAYFDHMQQSGLQPTRKIYAMLIECFGLAGRLDTACFLFGQSVCACLKPDGDVYTAIIKAYFWNQKPDMALQAFRNCTKAGFKPTAECIETMRKGLCSLKRKKEAKALQMRYLDDVPKENVLLRFEVLMQVYDILERNLVGKGLILPPTSSG